MRWTEPSIIIKNRLSKNSISIGDSIKQSILLSVVASLAISLLLYKLPQTYLLSIILVTFMVVFLYTLFDLTSKSVQYGFGRIIEVKDGFFRWGRPEDFEPRDPDLEQTYNISFIKLNEIVKTDFENVENIIVLTIRTENGKQQQFTIPDEYYLENKALIQNVMVNKNTNKSLKQDK